MKGNMRAAIALGIGYALGRKKRLRTATMMAAVAAFGSSSAGSLVLQRGLKVLSNTDALGKLAPQLGELADTVRGDLLDAGKAAVGAAVSNQVDSLTSSIHDRAERLRNPGDVAAAGADQATEAAGTAGRAASSGARRTTSTAGGAARTATGRGSADVPDEDDRDVDDLDDDYEADDYEPDEEDTGEPDEEDTGEPDEEDTGEPDEEDTGEPDNGGARGRRAAQERRGSAQRRSPVSRARR
jgi:hypothetical protein